MCQVFTRTQTLGSDILTFRQSIRASPPSAETEQKNKTQIPQVWYISSIEDGRDKYKGNKNRQGLASNSCIILQPPGSLSGIRWGLFDRIDQM